MKAVVVSRFGDENELVYKEVPSPEPAGGEVRVAIKAAGVNPVETYIRSGKYGNLPNLPYTPGKDGAGVVDAVGPGVTRLREGDCVFVAASLAKHCSGTYAEQVVCDAEAVQLLPDTLSFAQGAGLGTPGLTAATALFSRGHVKPGETVLVHGASGGVGTMVVQLARKFGAVVLGTAGSPEGMRLVKELGAHHVFNHNEEDYIGKIVLATDGAGPDLIIEMAANQNLNKDAAMIAKHGRIVVIGNHGSLDFDPRGLMAKDCAVIGMLTSNLREDEYARNLFALSAALENGLTTVVSAEIPLKNAAEAHREVLGKGKNGKVVLVV